MTLVVFCCENVEAVGGGWKRGSAGRFCWIDRCTNVFSWDSIHAIHVISSISLQLLYRSACAFAVYALFVGRLMCTVCMSVCYPEMLDENPEGSY